MHNIEPPKDAAAHIVERCAMVEQVLNGANAVEVAAKFGVSPPTVYKYVTAYGQNGLEGLTAPRKKRSNKPKITLQTLSLALHSEFFTKEEKQRVTALMSVWGGSLKLKEAASQLGMSPQALVSFRNRIPKRVETSYS